MGWDEQLERSSGRDAKRVERLANLLANWPGDRAHKVKWLHQQLVLIEAEAEATGIDPETHPRQFAGKVKALTIRWYRHHVLKMRAAGKHLPVERRDEEPEPLAAVLPLFKDGA